jgi:hypothetical protein
MSPDVYVTLLLLLPSAAPLDSMENGYSFTPMLAYLSFFHSFRVNIDLCGSFLISAFPSTSFSSALLLIAVYPK